MGFGSNIERKMLTLVVDDERDMSDMLKSMLESVGGYKVITAEGPEQAWSCVQVARFGLVISDIRMPNPGDGPRFVRQFATLPYSSKAGVILMSATIEDLTVDDRQFLAIRDWQTLKKPFDFGTVVDLAEYFRERQLAA